MWRNGPAASRAGASGRSLQSDVSSAPERPSSAERADPLADYRRKRDPGATTEPAGEAEAARSGETWRGVFVVHLHDATRRHFDLRLERGGVLASFAVPHGPSLDPEVKHLAVETEDHPLEYARYEGVIPEGNYGAGSMICWDVGEVRYLEKSAEQGSRDGKIDFVLAGHKLRGRFALVRLKKSAKGKDWLLFKKKDSWARTGPENDGLAGQPRSVLSGLTVDERQRAPELAAAAEAEARALGAPPGEVDGRRLSPMLCASAEPGTMPEAGYVYELKLDGVRVVADKRGDQVALTYRSGRDATAAYPEVERALQTVAAERVVLDGEVVAFGDDGLPSFQRLLQRVHGRGGLSPRGAWPTPAVRYVVFDVLALGPYDLRGLPWHARRELLHVVLPGAGIARALEHVEGRGAQLLEFCRARHLEGLVAKRRDAPYREGPRRTDDWLKVKCERVESFVVVGYTTGKGRTRLGALDLASHEAGRLVLRGKVGSGLDERTIDVLLERLAPLVVEKPVFEGEPAEAPLGRTFVKPELVVSVRFLGWSEDGALRFPVFRGMDPDREPQDCVAGPHGEQPGDSLVPAAGREAVVQRRVTLTNPDKLFWPKDGLTKGDLFRYYENVAPVLLPYLRDRPVALVRYPDGIEGKSFFQWNVPFGLPSWIRHVALDERETGGRKRVFLVDDLDALRAVANLGAIPLHVLACREGSLESCDFGVVDFDVDRASLAAAVKLARTLREILESIGLAGFAKTSGQDGLHVLVPLGPGASFETAQALTALLGRLVTERHPDLATMELRKDKRGARVFVDVGQTGRRRTIVAPYSARAYPGGRVSTPLTWDEVEEGLDPGRFTLRTVPERVARRGDPMAPLLGARPDLAMAVAMLGQVLAEQRSPRH
ncbi:MAG: DNA ligase D [Myxococcales bacterium]